MKKLLLLLVCGLISVSAFSQNDAKYASLQKALDKSDANIQKKATDPKTWISRAQTYLDLYGVNVNQLYLGMNTMQLKLFFKEPSQVRSAEKYGATVEEYVYPNISVFLSPNGVVGWKDNKNTIDNTLGKAKEALDKAASLDNSEANKKALAPKYKLLADSYENEAWLSFQDGDYANSFKQFENLYLSKESMGVVDTMSLVYTGVTAYQAKNKDVALQYADKAISLNVQDINPYQVKKSIFMESKDVQKAVDVLKLGMQNVKNDNSLLLELIQLYIDSDNTAEAISYLSVAKQQDPSNALFPFVEGTLYDKIKEYDNADKAFDQAIALRPDYFDALYSKGILFYNKAVDILEKANEESDNTKYEAMRKEAEEALKTSIAPLEKAHQVDPTSDMPLDVLKTVYFRLQMEDELQVVTDKLNALK